MDSIDLNNEQLEQIKNGDTAAFRDAVDTMHPAVVADFLSSLEDNEVWHLLEAIHPRQAAEIFPHFNLDRQVELTSEANHQYMARLIEALPHDDRADLVRHLAPELARQILTLVAGTDREDIRRLASYLEGSAGALMSSSYAYLRPDVSIAQALSQIRSQAPTSETIYYIYVVDKEHRLIGFVSLKDLIMAAPDRLVGDIMHEDIISIDVNEDQEPAARKIEKYDLLAIPVTAGDRKLVGVITHDDAMDVIRQEQQEDLEKLMAIGGSHEAGEYMRTGVIRHFRNRVTWVVALGILGLLSGIIVRNFEGLLLQFAILAAFMPMLADAGGNTGSQSATLVVRALALGEVKTGDVARIVCKEFGVSLLLAVVLAVVAFGRVLVFGGGSTMPEGYSLVWIATSISLALGLQVISATMIGSLLPLAAAKMKCDPALVASPALTTIVDITGLLLFFGTARLLLQT